MVILRVTKIYGSLAMSEKERKETKKVSRRNFLKGGAGYIIGGATSLGISGLALTGCIAGPGCRFYGEYNSATGISTQMNVEHIGECACPECDISMPHPRGVPCRTISCPRCGTLMVRGAI